MAVHVLNGIIEIFVILGLVALTYAVYLWSGYLVRTAIRGIVNLWARRR